MADEAKTPQDSGLVEYQAYVTGQLESLSEVLCEVADGNYDVFARSSRDDEFGDMAMMVNVLVNSVRRAVQREQAAVKQISEEAAKQDELLQELQEKLDIISQQSRAIRELSTPIIPIMDRILVVPLVGTIDSSRANSVMRTLLSGITKHRALVVILDVTGVPLVDTAVATHLHKAVQGARLKGAHTIVTGLSDAVAEIIVDLGIDWSNTETLADLQSGLLEALRRTGHKLVRRA